MRKIIKKNQLVLKGVVLRLGSKISFLVQNSQPPEDFATIYPRPGRSLEDSTFEMGETFWLYNDNQIDFWTNLSYWLVFNEKKNLIGIFLQTRPARSSTTYLKHEVEINVVDGTKKATIETLASNRTTVKGRRGGFFQ